MKKIKQIEKEQVMLRLANGEKVYLICICDQELLDLEYISINSIRERLEDDDYLYFTIEEVANETI